MDEITQEPQNLNKRMGIHLVSNAPWAQTGYGAQAKLVLPRWKALGFDVSMTAYYGLQGHTLNMNGVNLFPVGHHPYGMDVAAANTKMAGADIIITSVDAWVCEPQNFQGLPWCPHFPVDSGSLSPLIRMKMPSMYQGIVPSMFAKNLLKDEGYEVDYVPYCVDTKVFFPGDRAKALDEVNQHILPIIPKDVFLVAMVAMNKGQPSRKALCQNLQAFKELHSKHSDTAMYLHCTKAENGQNQGVDLVAYCKFIGLEIGKDVFFADELTIINGYPDVFLNAVYNAADVLTSVTMGEGFGVPIVEAQASGCPVIVGDWTAMPELLFSGWKVSKEESQEWWTTLGAIQYSPDWQAIYERMELAYRKRGNKVYRQRATEGAQIYDADAVAQNYWKPVLESIEARLKEKPAFTEPPK
jgi:glycosyltransferase involved in cell wall biosynthesis